MLVGEEGVLSVTGYPLGEYGDEGDRCKVRDPEPATEGESGGRDTISSPKNGVGRVGLDGET